MLKNAFPILIGIIVFCTIIWPLFKFLRKIVWQAAGAGDPNNPNAEETSIEGVARDVDTPKSLKNYIGKISLIMAIALIVTYLAVLHFNLPAPGRFSFINRRDGIVGIDRWTGKAWPITPQMEN